VKRSLRLSALVCGLVVLAISLGFAVPASAASGSAVIADCNSHNTLTKTYSISELETALNTMPADVSEYTDCKDVITRELLIQQGKIKGKDSSGGGSSSGSFLPTPVIIVLVVLLLAAATFGALALRRRRGGGEGPGAQPPSAAS
jgi:hypothetical protein